MATGEAEVRGRISIRPWRVGIIVDTSSSVQVRGAIADLSSVWGGYFMPILDISAPPEDLELQGAIFDVDSLYADVAEGLLADLLRKPGWNWIGAWRGRGSPFGEEHGFRTGLLPLREIVQAGYDLVQPLWESTDTSDLAYAAIWGLPDRTGLGWSDNAGSPGPRRLATSRALEHAGYRQSTGSITATTRHLRVRTRADLDDQVGVYIIRSGDSRDAVKFWNMRAYGFRLLGIPADCSSEVVNGLLRKRLPHTSPGGGPAEQAVKVWGLDDASTVVTSCLIAAAERDGLQLLPSMDLALPSLAFTGLETRFTRMFRADFRPGARWIDVALPELPVTGDTEGYGVGIVAAEMRPYRVIGQDPRLTASIPPFRRHSKLLRYWTESGDVDNARVTSHGQVVALDVTRDLARFSFVSNLDVFRLLLDDPKATVEQSELGKFQARAAENFNGPFGGVFNQPGIRSAVLRAAGEGREGMTLDHLRQTVERERGDWPEPFSRVTPPEYARRALDYVFLAGLFVPTLRVHCSYCRVERWASADELAAKMPCEFCGQEYNLALSHSLAQPKWRYRLAAHLRSAQVQALLPALAVSSLLGQFRLVEEAPLSHVFGLEVVLDGKKVEADIAVYLPDHDWTAVIGEVKNANRIDANDVENIEFVEHRLRARDVRCLSLFATLKSELTDQEVQVLRQRVERSRLVRTSRGNLLPSMPLVLTGPDLSHPALSEEHPWRWDNKGDAGILGTAITSCERNLGLQDYSYDSSGALNIKWRPPT